jgi:hypothetical protein
MLLMTVTGVLVCRPQVSTAKQSDSILEQIAVTRGICVVLGDAEGKLAVRLARDSELLIYVQSPRAKEVEAIRKAADDAGFYGTRVFVDKGSFKNLTFRG